MDDWPERIAVGGVTIAAIVAVVCMHDCGMRDMERQEKAAHDESARQEKFAHDVAAMQTECIKRGCTAAHNDCLCLGESHPVPSDE